MSMTKKDYEVIAEAIMDARRQMLSAFEPGTVPHAVADTAMDTVAHKIGKELSARYRGGYSFKWSRWNEATGTTEDPPMPTVRVLNDNEPDRLGP